MINKGRMNGVDPMATKYASLSPYNFSFNDPVTFSDVSGADPYYSFEDPQNPLSDPVYSPYTGYIYSTSYGWLQDDNIHYRFIGWSKPMARYGGTLALPQNQRGMEWATGGSMGAGWKPGQGSIVDRNKLQLVFGPVVYAPWDNAYYPAFEVALWDPTYQHASYRDAAFDAILNWDGRVADFSINAYLDNRQRLLDECKSCQYESTTKEISNYIDPSSLTLDGATLAFLDTDGTLMKMQSGQKLKFHSKEIVKILMKNGAASKAITVGTVLGKTGSVLGAVGIVLTWVQVGQGDKHWVHGLADTTMGVIGIAIPGPGTVVSIFYFAMTSVDGRGPSSSFTDTGLVPLDNLYIVPTYPKVN
jgi:hypothetical protein